MALFKGRKPETEDKLPHVTLPGDVKERLQLKPETPAKKRPVGENWKKFTPKADSMPGGRESARQVEKDIDDPVSGLGPKFVEDIGPISNRRHELYMHESKYVPSYDDVNGQEHSRVLHDLSVSGHVDREALKEKMTNEHSEHLYEEVVDKQTGKKSLLFRQNFFDRY